MFWTPAFAGVTLQETFYEIINIGMLGKPFSLSTIPLFHFFLSL